MINPDFLFVQNQVNRPTFTAEELDREIRRSTINTIAELSAIAAYRKRPRLSPRELAVMAKAGIVPVGNPLRGAGVELPSGEVVRRVKKKFRHK